MGGGAWVSLFSGGKDSTWALHRALQSDLDVQRLVTVHPEGDSYLYHVPQTELANLAAESIGIPSYDVFPGEFDTDGSSVGERGDAELAPLETALRDLDDSLANGLGGIVAGAVESEFQTSRIEAMAHRLDVELFAPLWQRDSVALLEAMLEADFEIRIVKVAARGLDEKWLGRVLDQEAMADLIDLNETYGVHVLGEGGEFETIVTAGPHMDRRIDLEYSIEWDGTRGSLALTDARLV